MKSSKKMKLGIFGGFEGALDYLGLEENAVFIFSPYKNILTSYNGNAIKVQRSSDFNSEWFEYKEDGLLDTTGILSFCGANDGLVEEVSNLSNTSYNATQTTLNYKPKIVESGVLNTNGVKFDAVDDFMNVSKYTAINITDHPLSVFVQAYTPSYANGYYMTVNTDSGTTLQYGLYNLSSTLNWKLNTNTAQVAYQNSTKENMLGVYKDGGTNAQIAKTNNNEGLSTYAATLGEQDFFNIGARSADVSNSTQSVFYNGYIKTIIIFNSNVYDKYQALVNNI